MKKKILLIITLLFWIIFTNISNAEDSAPTNVTITVWTQVPWVPCTMKKDDKTDGVVYVCSWIAWVLFIVINGILYSMWGIDDDLRWKSKERIIRTLTWLIILFSAWYILQLVAPWVYK